MNALRVRAVKFNEYFDPKPQQKGFDYGIQISQDSLCWFTVARYAKPDEAIQSANQLTDFFKEQMMSKPSHILWQSKV